MKQIKSKLFNEEQVQFILDNYKGITWKQMCELFNERFGTSFTYAKFKGFGSRHKLSNGVNCCFKKGQTPINKGAKMSTEMYERCKDTMFKPGSIPHNRREIGDERLDKDGYIVVKVADGQRNKNWKPKHHIVYESVHGAIPPKHKVVFLDGNKRNFEINNLTCVSNGIHAQMCLKHRYVKNTELSETNILITRLECETNKRKKKKI